MIHSRFPRFILFLLFIFAVLVPLGFIITALWNNILAVIFPIALINFWQALFFYQEYCLEVFQASPAGPAAVAIVKKWKK